MTDESASTAPKGDVWDGDMVSDDDVYVKQEFSLDDNSMQFLDH